MCERAVEADRWQFHYAPDPFKKQKMCGNVVWRDPYYFNGVPGCFMITQQIKIWRDSDYCDDKDVIR